MITFIANNNYGSGMSGGDRIWVELAKRWSLRGEFRLLGTLEALSRFGREIPPQIEFVQISPILTPNRPYSKSFILKNTLIKLFWGIKYALTHRFQGIVYSVSDFYPDFVPALIIKLLNPKIKWIAGYYLFAPEPWSQDNPYTKQDWVRGLAYYLSQLISYPLIKLFADVVFVTSEPDKDKFPRTIVIRGGVTLIPKLDNWEKDYDAIFIGRFHQQKGVLELVDIWKKVVNEIPAATLVMIGNGGLEPAVRDKIRDYDLSNNIFLRGFTDGALKNSFIMSSKIVVHPATYDSGGMATAEAMAFGLPAVGFDLECHKTYYPKGMIKARNNFEFAEAICYLLEDKILYKHHSEEAKKLIEEHWNWDKQAEDIWMKVTKSIQKN